MKKLLLLAAALVMSVGAWAQGTTVQTVKEGGRYYIKAHFHSKATEYLCDNGSKLTSSTTKPESGCEFVAVNVSEGGTRAAFMLGDKYLQWTSGNETSKSNPTTGYASTYNADLHLMTLEPASTTGLQTGGFATYSGDDVSSYVQIKGKGTDNKSYYFVLRSVNNNGTDNAFVSGAENNRFYDNNWNNGSSNQERTSFYEIEVIEEAPTTSPFDATKLYTFKNVADNRGYIAYNPAGGNYVGLADVTYSDALAAKHAQSSDAAVGINWVVTTTSEGKVTLYNSKKGQYMNVNNSGKCVWSDEPYEFVYELGEGYVTFKGNGNPSSGYLCPAPGYNANNGPVLLETSSTIKNEYKFYFEDVTEAQGGYTLQVGETGYASMFLDKNVTIPAGVKVYYCPEEWQDYVLKTVEIANDQVLPYYTAYVIEAPANQDYFFPYTEEEGGDFRNVDGLWGCASKAMNRQELHEVCFSEWGMNITNFYVLSVVDGKAGFYRYIGEEFALNKAFYFHPTSLANETQGFVLDFGGQTTGVDNVTTTTQSAASYDLQGRRVSKATRGLFIQNGVKVIR